MSSAVGELRLFLIAIAVALMFQLLYLPPPLGPLKPWLLGMVVCYYALEQPRYIGLGRAFLLGLLADALNGAQFGGQSLRLCILVFLLLRFRYRIRFFPLWQQTALIGVLFLNDCVLAMWVRMLGSLSQPAVAHWLLPITAALLWPVLFVSMDRMRRRQRTPSKL